MSKLYNISLSVWVGLQEQPGQVMRRIGERAVYRTQNEKFGILGHASSLTSSMAGLIHLRERKKHHFVGKAFLSDGNKLRRCAVAGGVAIARSTWRLVDPSPFVPWGHPVNSATCLVSSCRNLLMTTCSGVNPLSHRCIDVRSCLTSRRRAPLVKRGLSTSLIL